MSLWRRVYQERRAVMLPLVVLLLGNVGVLALAVMPLAQNVGSLGAASEAAGTNLLRARLSDKQAREAMTSKDRANDELRTFYSNVLPGSRTGALKVITSFLDRAAATAGLTFQGGQIDDADIKGSQLAMITEKVVLIGDYASIRKFLYSVETAEEFVVIESVGLAQASETRAVNSGRLEVALEVMTYYLVTPPAAQ